jgi:DNA-directed RNA polymerase specialized sigma24 family protein
MTVITLKTMLGYPDTIFSKWFTSFNWNKIRKQTIAPRALDQGTLNHPNIFNTYATPSFADKLNGIPRVQLEAFRLKTLKGIKTSVICNYLDISETQFWNYIHNVRVALM